MAITAAKLKVEVGADTSSAEQGLENFGSKLDKTAKNLGNIGSKMTLGVTAPILGIATAGLKTAAEFETNMNVLQEVVNASASDMAAMQQQALDLGASTVFGAGEAAGAMLELGKAGMNTEQIMQSITGVMELAAAGGVSLSEAANLTASTLNAFSLSAAESSRIANIMAATANASAADVSDLSQGMRQAGFAFALAEQPVENLAASLAILTNVGLTGSDAGTALKNAFMRMMNPTAEASGLMKELGINFYDTSGNMKALPDIIANLNAATAHLTSQQRDAALATIFLSDGMKAMIPLMEQGPDGFNNMVSSVTEAGAASEASAARMKGLAGGIEEMKGAVESFLIEQALPFTNGLGDMARAVGDAVTWFGSLPQPVINATLAFLGLAAAVGPVLLVMGGIAAALASPLLPMALLAVGIGALAAAWIADVGGMRTATEPAMQAIATAFTNVKDTIATFTTDVATAFSKTKFPSLETLWNQFKAGDFQTLATTIRSTAFELMVNLDTELNITAKANELKARLVEAVNAVTTAVGNLDFSSAATGFNKLRQSVEMGLTTAINQIDFSAAQSSLNSRFVAVSNAINTGVSSLVDAVQNFDLGSATANVKSKMNGIRDGILSGLTTAMSGVDWTKGGTTFAGLINDLSTAVTNLDFSGINWTTVLRAGLLGNINTAIVGIQWVVSSDQFAGLVTATQTAITSINWGELAGAFGSLGAAIFLEVDALFLDLVSDITAAITGIDWTAASLDFSSMVSAWTEQINSIDWSTAGANLATNIKTGVQNAMTSLGAVMAGEANVMQGLRDAVSNAFNNIQWGEVITSLFELETAVKTAMTSALVGALGSITGDLSQGLTNFTLPELKWSDFIPENLSWATFIPENLSWSTFIPSNLSWSLFIPETVSWGTYIVPLDWASFVSQLTWENFVDQLTWSNFVDAMNWALFIQDLSWGMFIPRVNWGDWLGGLLGMGGGSSPSTDSPGLNSGGSIGGNALGTPFWRGGATWVGERGPELVTLPRGSRIYNNRDSMAMAGSGGPVVVIEHLHVASELDAQAVSVRMANEVRRRLR